MRRTKLILALYTGIILSDMITFGVGRLLRAGIMEPLRKRMDLQNGGDMDTDTDTDTDTKGKDNEQAEVVKKRGKRERILAKLDGAGDYAGFVIRFSAGVRSPMMILTGYSRKVSFFNFAIGTMAGAVCTLSLQLLLGYSLRNNPAAVVGIIAGLSTFIASVSFGVAIVSWAPMIKKRFLVSAKAN